MSVLYKPECAVTDAVALQHASLSAASADDTLTFTAFSGDAATEAFNGGAAHGLSIANGAVVEINGASDEPVRFTGATGTLQLDDAPAFNGQISGLTGADTLDLRDISFSANTTATYLGNVAGGTLTITDEIDKANIPLVGNYLSSTWNLSSDGHGGTLVVDPASADDWQTLDVGAGGFVIGIDIAPNDTMVVRTDGYGAYLWTGTEWQQLITATSMPTAFVAPNDGQAQGVYEIQIAPSNSNILYMAYEGYVFKSTNDGTSWTETSFAPIVEDANDVYRIDGQKMAIDPENPNVVYVGTPANGLFVTTDGGATWQNVSAVPVSVADSSGEYPGITGIEFDPALGVTGGTTNTIFAASNGNGVYESTDAGASWSAIGGPSEVEYAAVSSTGVYYAVGNSNSLSSYHNGVWAQLLSESGIQSVTVDPFNPQEIVAMGADGAMDLSYDGGATWSGVNNNKQSSSSDIPWLANAYTYPQYNNFVDLYLSGTVFDQLIPNKLWTADGIGVVNATIPAQGFTENTLVNWNDQSLGIEELDANEIIVPPGGNPVLASWDRPFFYISDANAYPSTYGPVDNANIVAGWSIDYASSNPDFIVGLADNWGIEESGYSANGGQTWTAFPLSRRVRVQTS